MCLLLYWLITHVCCVICMLLNSFLYFNGVYYLLEVYSWHTILLATMPWRCAAHLYSSNSFYVSYMRTQLCPTTYTWEIILGQYQLSVVCVTKFWNWGTKYIWSRDQLEGNLQVTCRSLSEQLKQKCEARLRATWSGEWPFEFISRIL